MTNVIPTTAVLMVACTNTANFGDVLMYDPLTGAYLGNFPNGPGEYNSNNFQAPVAISGESYAGMPAPLLSCNGYSSPSTISLKIMCFNYNLEIIFQTWLEQYQTSTNTFNGLCYVEGFIYLLLLGGPVLRFYASSGQPAGLSGNPSDATFIPAGTVASGIYQGMACSPEVIGGGNLYVASGGEILIFSPSSGTPSGSIQCLGFTPTAMAFTNAGDLYVLEQGGNVLRFNGATGQPLGANWSSTDPVLIPAGTAGMPSGLIAGLCLVDFADGLALFLTAQLPSGSPGGGGGSVWQFDATTGDFEQVLVPSGSGGLNAPSSIILCLAEVVIPSPVPPPGPPPIIPPPPFRFPWGPLPWPRKPFIRRS